MSRLQLAIEQIRFARRYTLRLLDHTRDEDWCRIPPGGASHIVWQAGHLAFAQYGLALNRIRGPRTEDAELVTDEFLDLFRRLTSAKGDAALYPGPAALRETMQRVHEQVLREAETLDESAADEPGLWPHPVAVSKLDSLVWCAQHELTHAGQIGLLRRQLGYEPLW